MHEDDYSKECKLHSKKCGNIERCTHVLSWGDILLLNP